MTVRESSDTPPAPIEQIIGWPEGYAEHAWFRLRSTSGLYECEWCGNGSGEAIQSVDDPCSQNPNPKHAEVDDLLVWLREQGRFVALIAIDAEVTVEVEVGASHNRYSQYVKGSTLLEALSAAVRAVAAAKDET